jgi:hypothetical protein
MVAVNTDRGSNYYTVNYGVGNHFPGTRLVVYDLQPETMYAFRVFGSNNFIQEYRGVGLATATRSLEEISSKAANLFYKRLS